MKKFKAQSGITLIALIITIIVMLILVAVSVTVALNGGLFKTAKEATSQTDIEKEKELLLEVVMGAIGKNGKVDFEKLKESDMFTSTTPDGNNLIVTIAGSERTYTITERGSINTGGVVTPPEGGNGGGTTLTWTLTESTAEDNITGVSVGDIVTASNGESFYVIKTPEANETTVKLLAAKCVNTSTWRQDDSYNPVAFDEGTYDETTGAYFKPNTTTPVTNEYANASIKGLVETYVTGTLGLNANQGMLMSYAEATALQSGHKDMLYGTTTKWNYWLGSPYEERTDCAGSVEGSIDVMGYDYVHLGLRNGGLRPVIEISLSSISQDNLGGETPPTGGNGGETTLTWTLTEWAAEDNVTGVSVGDIVTASNGESFYVIKTPEAGATTVRLLAAKCVNTSTWTQDDSYDTVAFDSFTNEYVNASIKGLVETYVTETLGLNVNQGMLMEYDEAIALQSGHTDMLYGTTTKWNYWIGSSDWLGASSAWHVRGDWDDLYSGDVDYEKIFGLRPVIEISLSDIG